MHNKIPMTGFVVPLSMAVVFSILATASCHRCVDGGTTMEYEVYNSLINCSNDNRLIVIESRTNAYAVDRDNILDSFPGINPQTIADYQEKNQESHPLEDMFRCKVWLISSGELEEIFHSGGWDEFYARYPGSQGIMDISRVGFNEGCSEALVYSGNQWGPLAGIGKLLLLKKSKGAWTIVQDVMVWISDVKSPSL